MNGAVKCRQCPRQLSWDDRRRQYGRLIKRMGLTPERAAAEMPLCQKCVTEIGRHP